MAAGIKRSVSKRWRFAERVSLAAIVSALGLLGLASWWFTEPLVDRPGPVSGAATVDPTEKPKDKPPTWPEGRLEGEPAKQILLDALLVAAERLEEIEGYTATFHKQERIDGALGTPQTLQMKTRHHPFAIYLKFVTPMEGKEVVYAEGHHENKVIAHSGGIARLLVPRLALPPTHPLALAGSRHAVTEAGLANLTNRLIHYRKMDLGDAGAVTILDRYTDPAGKSWLRSVHTHQTDRENRPFARAEVLYDPANFFPMDIRGYDWPKPGETGELLLAEHYRYDDVSLNATLSAIDFDPANPDYAFHR